MSPQRQIDAERFRSLVEATHDWVWEVDPDFRYTYVGPRVVDILGYSPEEVLGKAPWDLMSPAEAERVGREMAPIAQGRAAIRGLVNRNRHRDGREVILETNAVPRFDPDGVFLGYLGTDRDVTGAFAQRDRLTQVSKLEAVAQLAGGIAHDFNNLLTSMLALTQAQIEALPDGSPFLGDLIELRRAAHRGNALIHQLLTFARVAPGQRAPARVTQVTHEAVQLVRAAVPAPIKLEFVCTDDALTAVIDPSQLHQVVMNLCMNARDAIGDRDGQIQVMVTSQHVEQDRPISHGLLRAGPWVVVRVSDSGCGIPPEHLDRLFEPFFTTKAPGKGTGLGLAAVHGIVADHGGVIDVMSLPGKGTRIEILLPRVDSASAQPTPAERVPHGTERVMIVDDDPLVLRSIGRFLSTLGYKVTTESHPDDALATILERPDGFDLVICDLLMPRQSGDALAAAIHDAIPHIPIALHTGWTQRPDEAYLGQHGVRAVLRKPLSPDVFAREVRRLLQQGAGLD